jgi:folate-binding protein YgfZ
VIDRGGGASFGDVTGEYLALRREAAFLTDWHEIVWVRGPDAVRFLDGLVSQAVASIEAGDVARSLLLAPQGKLRAPHYLLRGEHEVGLVVDLAVAETAAADLRRFKIRVDVVIDRETQPVIDVWGPQAHDVATFVVGAAPGASTWVRGEGETIAAGLPFPQVDLPRVVLVGVEPESLAAAGVARAGRLAADAVRIEAGEPIMGVDLDEGTIPQEGDVVVGAVDFAKGCYLGQELVARIDSRGHVNRHLRGVVVGTNVLPPLGAEIVAADKVVGVITSLAESLELRAPVALALVRREVEPGVAVSVRWQGGQVPARIADLPLDTFAAV